MNEKIGRGRAASNIALVKYWGKRDISLNLPQSSSFSITLNSLYSVAEVSESPDGEDHLLIRGNPNKAKRLLLAARKFTGDRRPLRIKIENNFPTAAGLASSASSMAALALALRDFWSREYQIPFAELTKWARLASGSAVRSLLSGYVLWRAGSRADGSDSSVEQLFPPQHFPLSLIACIVRSKPKEIGSTEAMEHCRKTSPFYWEFHRRIESDLERAISAVAERDIWRLGAVAEENCLAMHRAIRESRPPIDYLLPESRGLIDFVRELREKRGVPCFFTIDAGPNVKIFTLPRHKEELLALCRERPEVEQILTDDIGTELER